MIDNGEYRHDFFFVYCEDIKHHLELKKGSNGSFVGCQRGVFIVPTLSSRAAPEVAITTNCRDASNDRVGTMTIYAILLFPVADGSYYNAPKGTTIAG